MDSIVTELREKVLSRIDLSKETSDEELEELIAQEVSSAALIRQLTIADRVNLEQLVFNSLRKLDVISELMEDETVTEIMVNGPQKIFYEKEGKIFPWDKAFASEERVLDILQQIVANHNRVINLSSPIVDTRLRDGSRVNAVLSPISVDHTVITIRKFPKEPLTMNQLIRMKSISSEAAELLEVLVKARYSIVVSGGTGSGKTTFLNALSAFIPRDERIITIEDSAELQIQGIENLVRLETRNANIEGVREITIRDLIRTALRMRPDRIIVGECRGAEAFDMLAAFTTGHDGSFTSLHANSAKDVVSRLETMVLMGIELPLPAIQRQIASGVDIIVHLGRIRDKSRRVLEITEIYGMEKEQILWNPLYRFEESKEGNDKVVGELKKVGCLKNEQKIRDAGIKWNRGISTES